MYGFEEGKTPKTFQFDLEKEILKSPKRAKEIIEKNKEHIQEIKKTMREGGSKKEIDELETLFHGYTSLEKVLTRIKK